MFGMANNGALYNTSIIVKFVREYIDYGNIIASIILDIATAVKLYKFNRKDGADWSKQKATLERLFLLQVCKEYSKKPDFLLRLFKKFHFFYHPVIL